MGTNITTVVTVGGSAGPIYANCASGYVATGGGAVQTGSDDHMISSAPTVGAATSSGAAAFVGTGAVAKGWEGDFNAGTTTVYVICDK